MGSKTGADQHDFMSACLHEWRAAIFIFVQRFEHSLDRVVALQMESQLMNKNDAYTEKTFTAQDSIDGLASRARKTIIIPGSRSLGRPVETTRSRSLSSSLAASLGQPASHGSSSSGPFVRWAIPRKPQTDSRACGRAVSLGRAELLN